MFFFRQRRYITRSSFGRVYISHLQSRRGPISWLSAVREKTCKYEPRESLLIHIKQLDGHRERGGCFVNLLVAT